LTFVEIVGSNQFSRWRWGSRYFCRWGVERRGGGRQFFKWRIKKEVGIEFCHHL